ncbi:Fungalysin metallopeptidase-domain-containing protein [Cantharellus anzutake]|uniref:Fungalysin metallopeptidase-domain-containing protein n=1 Tax=Cantharellus anzutake TaxID=1750568 RepID=UPI001906ED6D|nr:Fungalysin metallopeptidase-domain-containing protein [Cantharellus anzutake]KAF8335418.1 Fungalysin metallopeptidase-domain-containing protein [Cantharellus anzutake]
MRSFVGIYVTLAAAAVAHQPSARKSLGFGPENPTAKFLTHPAHVPSFAHLNTPRDVALNFLTTLPSVRPGLPLVEGLDFIIRDDSYTDERTGVSHIYVRQLWNGVELSDGDIHLNILSDEVISYSDSFFRGRAPYDFYNNKPAEDHHGTFCAKHAGSPPAEELSWDDEQLVIGRISPSSKSRHINCNTISIVNAARLAFDEADLSQDGFSEPQKALLHFMIAAHPSPEYAESLLHGFEKHLEKMNVVYTYHLTGANHHPAAEVQNVPGALGPVKAKLVYVQSPTLETQLTLAWKFEVKMQDNWYEAYMDASHPSYIHTVIDWVSDAPLPRPVSQPKYNVWKWGINDPSEGVRSVESGYDKLASPLGWHSLPFANDPSQTSPKPKGLRNTTTTWGNNVIAHEDWEGAESWLENYRPVAEDLNFNYKYGPEDKPSSNPKDYINLTVTQLFYTINRVHDLYYRYGFDEVSGNFQQYNFGKGGKEGDGVIANAQDGSGTNNANFATPPDGQHGICRMYIWNTATPYRDGSFEAGIVIHELTHGLSTRLTGGPANSGCLPNGESGGMGEGWGVRSTSAYKDFPMGAWAANNVKGIRHYPYSIDKTFNPTTYKILDRRDFADVHAIGEVWAEILWIIEQKLIKKHGFTDTLFPPQQDENGVVPEGDFYNKQEYRPDGTKKPLVPKHGNSLILQLVINALKLQPCRPTFFNARDAIIQADQILTGGQNKCELWTGFSERGLGPNAKIARSPSKGGNVRTDDFNVPAGACNE